MRIHVLGSSGTYPVPGRPASGYLIQDGATSVWCEAGPGTFLALSDRIELASLDAIVLSHRHPDHCTDIFTAFHAFTYGAVPRSGIPVLAPGELVERLKAFVGGAEDHPITTTFAFDPVQDGDKRRIGSLSVSFAEADHSVPTVATRWDDGARTLAYSGDTGPGGEWLRVAEEADLFLCEATHQVAGANDYPFHLSAAEAGELARKAGARRLMLTHIPPHLDPARSVEEAEATFGRPVLLAVPRASHKV